MSEEQSQEQVEKYHEKLKSDAEAGGYHLNPDGSITGPLLEGLLRNSKRYGYALCPCRLTGRSNEADLDIICPCDYRDLDLEEYGNCY